jgi:hypothetical protein
VGFFYGRGFHRSVSLIRGCREVRRELIRPPRSVRDVMCPHKLLILSSNYFQNDASISVYSIQSLIKKFTKSNVKSSFWLSIKYIYSRAIFINMKTKIAVLLNKIQSHQSMLLRNVKLCHHSFHFSHKITLNYLKTIGFILT